MLAGAAAVDPRIAAEPALLALALFFWTPPHFWSLALYNREDYQRVAVPMLAGADQSAQVGGHHSRTRHCRAHLSLLPAAFGAGAVYLSCAASVAASFSTARFHLVRTPRRVPVAWSCFKASSSN